MGTVASGQFQDPIADSDVEAMRRVHDLALLYMYRPQAAFRISVTYSS